MIFIIGRIFPQYRKAILDELAQKMELKFLHSQNNSGIKQTTAPYSLVIKKFIYGKNDTSVFLSPFYNIIKHKPKVVIHELAVGITSLPFTLLLCRILGIHFVLWGHAYDHKRVFDPVNSLKDKFRLSYLRKADAILAYTNGEKEFLARYVDDNKVFIAQNTLDVPRLLEINERLGKEGMEAVKKRLNISQKHNLIFIGRLLQSKRPEVLINIYEHLTKKLDASIGIHFVGSGEMRDELIKKTTDKGYESDFYFHGSIHDEKKSGALLYISDMMVMPGYLGLSVNHAFCFECPVVSFQQGPKGPFHSPEVEYVENGETGFLIETDDVEMMTANILNYLMDENLQSRMKKNIQNMITNVCSINNMEKGFIDCLRYLNPDVDKV